MNSLIYPIYLGSENFLKSLEVVALLVIIVHLQRVGGVAGVQSPQYNFTHIVRSLLRVYYDPSIKIHIGKYQRN